MELAGYDISIITYVTDPTAVQSYNFSSYKLLYVPSSNIFTTGGLDPLMNSALLAARDRVAHFINVRGADARGLTG